MTSDSIFLEKKEKLRIRIHAHTAYANFKLEDWLLDWLGDSKGGRLLEVGCGDGNFFPTYAKALGRKGLIIGLDKNQSLLDKAREAQHALATPGILFLWDFDVHPYPLLDGEVGILIAPYSAYYAEDVAKWINDGLRVLKPGGRLLLLGPTRENARELYELNERVSGVRSFPEIDESSAKLEAEFLPQLSKQRGLNVKKSILARTIVFPSAEEFAKYYLSTWLFERTLAQLGRPVDVKSVVRAAQRTTLRLNKEIICIEADKNDDAQSLVEGAQGSDRVTSEADAKGRVRGGKQFKI